MSEWEDEDPEGGGGGGEKQAKSEEEINEILKERLSWNKVCTVKIKLEQGLYN